MAVPPAPGCYFFDDVRLSPDMYRTVMLLMRSCILATDLANLRKNKKRLEALIEPKSFDWNNQQVPSLYVKHWRLGTSLVTPNVRCVPPPSSPPPPAPLINPSPLLSPSPPPNYLRSREHVFSRIQKKNALRIGGRTDGPMGGPTDQRMDGPTDGQE